MYKHVCLIRKKTEPDGTWHYELDAMTSYHKDTVMAELVLAQLTDRDPHVPALRDLSGMSVRLQTSPESEGWVVYDAPVELSKEAMNDYIKSLDPQSVSMAKLRAR